MPSELGYVFADALAGATDSEQAEFLNRLGTALFRACKGSGYGFRESQLCRIADHLDGAGNALVTELAAFVKLTEQARVEQRAVERDLSQSIRRLEEEKRSLERRIKELSNVE